MRGGQLLFELRHAVEEAEEVDTRNAHRINTFVAQFAQEAAVTIIDGITDLSQVLETVIGGAAVDVVDSHTGRDGFAG